MLEAVHERLAGVVIECLGFEPLLRQYDRPGALFYLDPPYYGSEKDYGRDVFGRSDFERLAELLRGLKGRFLLSLNDVPAVRRIFAGLAFERVHATYTLAGSDKAQRASEVIISPLRRS